MDFFLRRGRPEWLTSRAGDQQPNTNSAATARTGGDFSPQPEMQQSGRHLHRFSFGLPIPFTRRPTRSDPNSGAVAENGGASESPKTPRFNLRLPNTSYFSFSRARESSTVTAVAPTHSATRPPGNNTAPNGATHDPSILPIPEPVAAPPTGRTGLPTWEELPTSPDDRRRRRRRLARAAEQARDEVTGRPRRFLFCLPWIPSRRARNLVLQCFVSGLFMTLLLSVCKSPIASLLCFPRFTRPDNEIPLTHRAPIDRLSLAIHWPNPHQRVHGASCHGHHFLRRLILL